MAKKKVQKQVVDQEYVKLDAAGIATLKAHPQNPNIGDKDSLAASMGRNGFYGAVIVQKGSNLILAGHHRVQYAKEKEFTELPVIFVDVDDKTANRILVADNQITRLGENNNATLVDLLQGLTTDGDTLEGTGFDDKSLAQLMKSFAPTPPTSFKQYDGSITTDHTCPKCGYEWSGASNEKT